MPTVTRAGPSHHVKTEQPIVGGEGGFGSGPSIQSPLIWIDEDLKVNIPEVDTVEFCKEHGLGDDICGRLIEHGYEGTDTLFVEKESNLKKLGFKIGDIAELRWALKKLLLAKFPKLALRNSREEYRSAISGGQGGAGGYGGQKGGGGGDGKAPHIEMEDVWRFRRIGGGTGGLGGATRMDGAAGAAGASLKAPVEAPLAPKFGGAVPLTVLEGGVGGSGGWGVDAGGAGGGGGGPQMAIEYTRIVKEIVGKWVTISIKCNLHRHYRCKGGVGGSGGDSPNQGGQGGSGEAPNLTTLLCSVGNATRNRVPDTKLNSGNLKITPALLRLLQDHGFRTVGGLFETYQTDLDLAGFKAGHVSKLKAILVKVEAQAKATQAK
ncbi:hypothetical protein DFH08DRAFT_845811 [Mycena albidolilacea]|uniref:SAM domain-containing protein n=1 Tax=Mycena albidolilacea TaxID=1033008 RepID=A0AAD7AII9_9AGAR|nr:hypothetical protein DFH08DRAFT_845811 [Mycena albidolilacea]